MLLDMEAENKNGNMSPEACAVKHKKGHDSVRYVVSAYPLDNNKQTKITQQFGKLAYCKYNNAAKFAADAPKVQAFDLLRAAIDGGHASSVAGKDDIVKWKQQNTHSYSLTGGGNLAAVHSLSAVNFLAAVELGGMPMPSVAVTRLDRPYEWGGAGYINLIGKPEMVDPRKGADVYSADAWAGTMPLVERRPKKVKAREVTFDDLYALDKQYGTVTHGMCVCISWDYEGKRTDEAIEEL